MNINDNTEDFHPTEDEIAGAQEAEATYDQDEQFDANDGVYDEVPAGLKEIDPEKMAAMKARLKAMVTNSPPTEAPAGQGDEQPEGTVSSGKDVDWSEYELPKAMRHLYPIAQFRMFNGTPMWVAMVDQFYSDTRRFGSHGKMVKAKYGPGVEPLNLGDWLSDKLNGPDGWKVVSLLPLGTDGAGVLLQRAVPIALPDPIALKKDVEVAEPTDTELAETEAAALAFAENVGTPAEEHPQVDDSLEGAAIVLNGPPDRDPGPLGSQKANVNEKGFVPAAESAARQLEAAIADGTIVLDDPVK